MKEDSLEKFNSPEHQLVYSASQGHYYEVKKLLEEGVSPNCLGIVKTTPLIIATTYKQYRIIDLLISFGADINFETGEILSFSRTPLATACHLGDLEMAEYLLQRGADIELMSGVYGNPLHAAIGEGNLKLIKFLIDQGANLEAKHGVYFDTPLCAAVRIGNIDVVALLIESGAKIKPIRKMPRKVIRAKMVKYLKARGCL